MTSFNNNEKTLSLLDNQIDEIEKNLDESENVLLEQGNEESSMRVNSIVCDMYLEFNLTPSGFDFEKSKLELGH